MSTLAIVGIAVAGWLAVVVFGLALCAAAKDPEELQR